MTRQIDHETLRRMMDRGERFTLLDVRDTPDYRKAHLPGAVHLLIADMDELADTVLDRNLPVVTYSADYNCPASTIAAEKLEQMGYTAMDYKGSYQDWLDRGYHLES